MLFSLRRTRDGAGDSGPMSVALWREGDNIKSEDLARPRVGVCMKVGSPYARSYNSQDWWMTTFITEIIEDQENYVRFKTGNSEYEWKVF